MSRSLSIPEELYERLEHATRERGLGDVVELLRETFAPDANHRRREVVAHVHRVREDLRARYGEMQDSTPLIQADRARFRSSRLF